MSQTVTIVLVKSVDAGRHFDEVELYTYLGELDEQTATSRALAEINKEWMEDEDIPEEEREEMTLEEFEADYEIEVRYETAN